MRFENLMHIAAGIALIAVIACSSSDSTTTTTGAVKLSVKSASAATLAFAQNDNQATGFTGTDFGAAAVGAGGLSSLKLYISSIQLCNSMTVSGSAYNNPSGCATVYSNPNATDAYSSFTTTSAATAGTGKYFDILSATDRALLTASASIATGTYNWGIISWYRPIKITGSVLLQNGNTLSTAACTSYSPGCVYTGMTTTTATETIYDSGNGGTWFKFLSPFVVTQDSTTQIDLAFDMDKKLFGGSNVSNGFASQATGCSGVTGGYCGLYIPGIRIMPVPRQSTQTTKMESYVMSMTGTPEWSLKVDVFYNSGDSTKAVLAADVFPIPTANVNSSIAAGTYVAGVTISGTQTVFNDYSGNASLTFIRGASGTATFVCPSGASLAGCTAGGTVSLTYSAPTVVTMQN